MPEARQRTDNSVDAGGVGGRAGRDGVQGQGLALAVGAGDEVRDGGGEEWFE